MQYIRMFFGACLCIEHHVLYNILHGRNTSFSMYIEICVNVLIAFLTNKLQQPSCVVDVIVQFTFEIRRDWTHF